MQYTLSNDVLVHVPPGLAVNPGDRPSLTLGNGLLRSRKLAVRELAVCHKKIDEGVNLLTALRGVPPVFLPPERCSS